MGNKLIEGFVNKLKNIQQKSSDIGNTIIEIFLRNINETISRKDDFVLTMDWLVKYLKERLEANKNKKIIFADLKQIFNDEVRKQAKKMSLEDLEKMCDETPYISAVYDESSDTVENYEGLKPVSIDSKVEDRLKENEGLLLISA